MRRLALSVLALVTALAGAALYRQRAAESAPPATTTGTVAPRAEASQRPIDDVAHPPDVSRRPPEVRAENTEAAPPVDVPSPVDDVDRVEPAGDASGSLRGRLMVNGEGQRAWLECVRDPEERLASTFSSDDGRFDFGAVPAGQVRIVVRLGDAPWSSAARELPGPLVVVPHGATAEVVVSVAVGSLEGRVVDEGGAPIEEALVMVTLPTVDPEEDETDPPAIFTTTGAGGAYSLSDLPAGLLEVEVTSGQHVHVSAQVAIAPAAPTTRDFVLPRRANVRGRIVPNRAVAPGHVLLFEIQGPSDASPEGPLRDRAHRLEPDGSFEHWSAAGRWQVVVHECPGGVERRPALSPAGMPGMQVVPEIRWFDANAPTARGIAWIDVPPTGLEDAVVNVTLAPISGR